MFHQLSTEIIALQKININEIKKRALEGSRKVYKSNIKNRNKIQVIGQVVHIEKGGIYSMNYYEEYIVSFAYKRQSEKPSLKSFLEAKLGYKLRMNEYYELAEKLKEEYRNGGFKD